MNKVSNLSDASKKLEEEHATKVKKLFEEHPEIAKDALIISPGGQVTLTPEYMSTTSIVGILEAAKFGVLFQTAVEQMEGDEK